VILFEFIDPFNNINAQNRYETPKNKNVNCKNNKKSGKEDMQELEQGNVYKLENHPSKSSFN
jgi:hypothetical protein